MSIAVTTHHNDRFRTGANLGEARLNARNVNRDNFGKLFELPVDGQIYGQVLYVPSVDVKGHGERNVAYAATMHNTVYCFDADQAGPPLWHKSLGPSIQLPNRAIGPRGYKDIEREIGVISTPVISLERGTIYVVAATENNGVFAHHLHALDLSSGDHKFGGPRELSGSVPGSGEGAAGGVVSFISNRQNQRSALLLANDIIYIAFAAYEDTQPYHGWIFGRSADTLEPLHMYNVTPDGEGAGIWQGGQGPSADDDGNIYVMSGNGTFAVTSIARKVTLPESASSAPAIAVFRNMLAMAWTAAGRNPELQIALSADGTAFPAKTGLQEKAIGGPALATASGRLFLAWTDAVEKRLRLMSLTKDVVQFEAKVTLKDASPHGPALAFGNGRLYVAWTGDDAKRRLHVMSSRDGVTFENRVRLPFGSAAGPALAFIDGKLYLLWIADDAGRTLNIMESADGITFQNRVTLADSSDFPPAMLRTPREVLLFWTARDARRSLKALHGESPNTLRIEDTHRDQGAFGPAAATFLGHDLVAWTGTDSGRSLNVARLGPPMPGNAVIKLSRELTVLDWFSPFNTHELNAMDGDLGSGGVLVLPGTNLVVGGSKEGKLYVLDRNRLGRFNTAGDTQIVQSFQAAGLPNNGVPAPEPAMMGMHHIHGSPIYWNSDTRGPMIYMWPEADWLRAYRFDGSKLDTAPADMSTAQTPPKSMPGAMLSLSADGGATGTGIVWASHPTSGNANQRVVPGMLRAIDADNLERELWNSEMHGDRDRPGDCAKFSPPTVANGRVYLATFSNKIAVYGLI